MEHYYKLWMSYVRLTAHLVKFWKALLYITAPVSVPLLVMLLYTFHTWLHFAFGVSTTFLEVTCTSIAPYRLWVWMRVVVCACVVDGSSTVVFAEVALVIDEVTDVVCNTLFALVDRGSVRGVGGAILVDICNTIGTASLVGDVIGVTLLFNMLSALTEVAFSSHKLGDVFAHAVKAVSSALATAVLVEVRVASATLGVVGLSAACLVKCFLALVVTKVASLLHEITCVLLDALETLLSLANVVGAKCLKVRGALFAVSRVRLWCVAY